MYLTFFLKNYSILYFDLNVVLLFENCLLVVLLTVLIVYINIGLKM